MNEPSATSSVEPKTRDQWESMSLTYIGQLGDLMQAATGSRQDNGAANCGGQGRQHVVGKACY